jgi:translation initiation factor IF-1
MGINGKAILPREEGIVEEALPALTFRVRLDRDGQKILAHLAGKLKIHYIKVLPGDRVIVELGQDRRRGRIVRRL